MMLRSIPFGLLLLAATSVIAEQDAGDDHGGRLSVFERFSGEVRIATREGEKPVRIDVRNWIIAGGMELERLPLPFDGLLIVQHRGGELVTTTDGRRQERLEGEIWTVPSGVAMGVVTEDDSAILQTILIAE